MINNRIVFLLFTSFALFSLSFPSIADASRCETVERQDFNPDELRS